MRLRSVYLAPSVEYPDRVNAPIGSPGPSPSPSPEPQGDLPGPAHRAGLFALAFGSGFGVMVLEIAGARVMAPVYGLSAVPWTAIIGVVLTALAAGSWLGGRLADRETVPLSIVLMAAAGAAVLPVVGGPVPRVALSLLGFIPGAIFSAMVFFALPVFGLGMVVPYLIRAETRSLGEIGRRAGEISAAATAGSIAGTFGTGFVLLPLMPLQLLLGLTAAGFVGLAVIARALLPKGGAPGPRNADIVVVTLLLLGAGVYGSIRPGTVLADVQTVYAAIEVRDGYWTDDRPVREMRQSGGSSSIEYLDTGEPAHLYAKAALSWLEELDTPPRRVLVLGGAALTLPLAIARRYPDVTVDVVELDPAATRLAYRHFAIGDDPAAERVQVVHDAGRHFLETTDQQWDLIYLDVFDNLVTVPWTVVTEEAFRTTAERLAPGGQLMANVLTPLSGPGTAFLQRLLATAESVFPQVRGYVVQVQQESEAVQNVMMIMAPEQTSLPEPPWRPVPVQANGPTLRDDFAPVEYLQARVFWQGLNW